jgi:hypothetical protein
VFAPDVFSPRRQAISLGSRQSGRKLQRKHSADDPTFRHAACLPGRAGFAYKRRFTPKTHPFLAAMSGGQRRGRNHAMAMGWTTLQTLSLVRRICMSALDAMNANRH